MKNRQYKRPSPVWLTPTWEDRKRVTADCVEVAVRKLRETDQAVTLSSIKKKVALLFGRSLSMNTIKRNERAYQVYVANRRAPKTSQVESELVHEFYENVEPARKAQ
jgi:hypothetical protein